MAVVAAVATAVTATAVGGAVASGKAHKAMRGARNEKERAAMEVKRLQDSRQTIINPYAGVESLADLAQDLTGMMSNPYSQMGVATQAAEFQAEEADIALANTLDTLMATGAGAGGATALAQAALRSKKGISASIETQEAANEKMRAEGEKMLMEAKIGEQRRLQGVAIAEGQREQQAETDAALFKFNAQEDRDNADIAYQISKETGAAQRQAQYRQNRDSATAGIFSGIGSIAGSVAGGAIGAG